MSQSTTTLKKPKRKRGRPAKNRIEPIEATPEEIGQALAKAANRRAEERRKEQA